MISVKPFKTIYMTLYQGEIIFPKEVLYLDDGYYLCTGQLNNKYVITDRSMAKLSQADFDMLIRRIHTAMYKCHPMFIELRNIEDDMPFPINIYPNGQIRCMGYKCTLYVPRNCTKWDCCLLKGYFNDSYVLLPCDKNGKVIEKEKHEANPYSNNCNAVYKAIAENPGINTSDLIDLLGWPPNSVTSRISELISGSRIYSVGRVVNPKSGRKVHKWMTAEDIEGNSYVL